MYLRKSTQVFCRLIALKYFNWAMSSVFPRKIFQLYPIKNAKHIVGA